MRAGGLFQDANVAGRNYVTDDRWGAFISTKYTPTNDIKITTNYVHTDLSGLPDFGVPYYRQGNVPVTSAGIPRGNWYGFLNRDFQTARQDFGTGTIEYKVNEAITLTSKVRGEHSLLNYIGTLPQNPITTNPNPLLWTTTASAQSRYQTVDVSANQNEATFKLDTGGVKHTRGVRRRISRNENISIDRYTGLASEAGRRSLTSNGASPGQSSIRRSTPYVPFGTPTLAGNPTRYGVDTSSVYVMDTANWQDTVIVNGGVRYDGYRHERSSAQRGARPESQRRSRQLQRRRGLQADVDRQPLCGLCDLGQSVRLGARRDRHRLRRRSAQHGHPARPRA